MFSDHSICFAYLGFPMLLYFGQHVFLMLDNVFSYYNKATWWNQNKVINERNNALFHLLKCVISKQFNSGGTSSLKCYKTKS